MNISLYTIPYEVANESIKINRLFEMGLEELHLRKMGFDKKEIIYLLENIRTEFRNRIVLHSNYDLAIKFKLKGIHVPSNFFDGISGILNKFNYLNKNLQITTTVFNCSKIESTSEVFDKIYLGPIYSKSNRSNFDSFELSKTLKLSNKPIFAIGGVSLANKEKLEAIGFDGVVLQSAIWKAANIYNAFNAFILADKTVHSVSDRIQRAG